MLLAIIRFSISISLIFSGFSKIIWIKETSKFVGELGLFPKNIGKYIGFLIPFIEFGLGIGWLMSSSKYIIYGTIFIFMFFVSLNFYFVLNKRTKKCFCYGKMLSSKLSKGGLFHYVYLLLVTLSSLVLENRYVLGYYILESYNVFVIIFSVIIVFLNSILIQQLLDLSE